MRFITKIILILLGILVEFLSGRNFRILLFKENDLGRFRVLGLFFFFFFLPLVSMGSNVLMFGYLSFSVAKQMEHVAMGPFIQPLLCSLNGNDQRS